MQKIILTLILCSMIIQGAWLENVQTELIQPDGSKLTCLISGDEFYHRLHDSLNYTIIQSADGFFYYAVKHVKGVIPSEYRADSGEIPPSEIMPGIIISADNYQKMRNEWTHDGLGKDLADIKASHTGIFNNLVIYIRFSDDNEFSEPRQFFDDRLNAPAGYSVKSFYKEASYQKLTLQSHHYPVCDLSINISYQDSNARAYYEPYNEVTNPIGYPDDGSSKRIREHTLLKNAINAVISEVPSDINFDANNDGYIDNICFIVKKGQSAAWGNLLWPHAWVLYTYNVAINGKRAYQYTLQGSDIGVKTLSHELGHALGFPDLYHYESYSSYINMSPVGSWDLMSSGSGHMSTWSKYKYAQKQWINDIPVAKSNGIYSLKPLGSSEKSALKVNSTQPQEFFILEYRKKTGDFESRLLGEGLLVYRINLDYNGNTNSFDEIYIYRPDGTPTATGQLNKANFSSESGRTLMNRNSNPRAVLFDGSFGSLFLEVISTCADSITFRLDSIVNTPLIELPHVQKFSGENIPGGWHEINSSQISGNVWQLRTTANAGGYSGELRASKTDAANATSLIASPPIRTAGLNGLKVSFLTKFNNNGTGLTARLRSSSDGINWQTENWQYHSIGTPNSGSNQNYGPDSITVAINRDLTEKTYLAFSLEGNFNRFYYWYIDNLRVEAIINSKIDEAVDKIVKINHYPNPFNLQTKMSYVLKNESLVEFCLYNSSGELVLKHEKANKKAGLHNIDINAADLSSGVYFSVLKTGSRLFMAKIALIK